MDFELAKALKDAGWKDNGDWEFYYPNSAIPVLLPAPTLKELIEACGESVDKEVFTLIKYPENWTAGYSGVGDYWRREIGHGPTPTEAVARLWLAIQKQ